MKNKGKEIKDLGTFIIIIGIVLLLGIVYLFVGSTSSPLYRIVNHYFFFEVVGGLVALLVGIIVRSIGKSKEDKFNQLNK